MRRNLAVCVLSILIPLILVGCGNSDEANGSRSGYAIVETIPADDSDSGELPGMEQEESDKLSSFDALDNQSSAEMVTSVDETGLAADGSTGSTDDKEKTGTLSTDSSTEESVQDAESYLSESADSQKDAEIEKSDPAKTEGSEYTIVLDPGHSSVISGTTEPLGPGSSELKASDSIGTHGDASGLMEYQLNLTVCQKLRTALQNAGYHVILTREDSTEAISCAERAQIANNADADVFLRVHANGAESSSANGAMTICITQNNPYTSENYSESSRLSETLLDEYCSATGRRKERVWYTDSMTGNNWSKVPTTLLEMGYMTNPNEDLWMASEAGQTEIVTGVVNGLNSYFDR